MKAVKSINPFKYVILTRCDIVKAHGGELHVDIKAFEFTSFTILL